jgi:hypothetical protein
MGFPGYRRTIRASLAYVGMAAATASALVVLQSGAALAVSATPDAITVTPASGTALTVGEGNAAARILVGKFTDTGRPGGGGCNTESYVATIDWGDGSNSTSTSMSCENDGEVFTGTFDVYGGHTYADSGPYTITMSVVDNSESAESSGAAVKTDTANVTDAQLEWDVDNSTSAGYSAVEGKSVTVAVDFFDHNSVFSKGGWDASASGTIDWGDGSPLQAVQPSSASALCDCTGDFEIRASHVYDAPVPPTASYHIVVTAKEDGGSTATADFSATISDAALTSGGNLSLGATATQAFNSVVGTFTDAAGAQAAAGDHVAIINWGDNTSSTGTVTKTGTDAFGVSGTHTYATAGSKSITATVTDEEGSTVTLRATDTVAAAPAVAPVTPVVLPATGQPHQPAIPMIPLALVILALVSLVAGGRILAKMPR